MGDQQAHRASDEQVADCGPREAVMAALRVRAALRTGGGRGLRCSRAAALRTGSGGGLCQELTG